MKREINLIVESATMTSKSTNSKAGDPVGHFSWESSPTNFYLQSIQLSCATGKLEDLDAGVKEAHPDRSSTLNFVLQGEEFDISACELRDLLRSRLHGSPVLMVLPERIPEADMETLFQEGKRVGWNACIDAVQARGFE